MTCVKCDEERATVWTAIQDRRAVRYLRWIRGRLHRSALPTLRGGGEVNLHDWQRRGDRCEKDMIRE